MATPNSWAARLNARRHQGRSPQERERDSITFKEINTPIRRASQSAAWNRGYNYNASGNRKGY